MPKYSYLNFLPDSEDMNVPGSSDVTKPSEGWKGRDANNSLRATNSGLRNLGDIAAKLPLNADGSIRDSGPRGGQIGTMAFQNTDNAIIDGGVLGRFVRGSLGEGALVPVLVTAARLAVVYEEMRFRGFDLCDGRITTNPYPPFNTINPMPDLRGMFLWMCTQQDASQLAQPLFNTGNGGYQPQRPDITVANSFKRVTGDPHTHGRSPDPLDPGYNKTGQTTLGYPQLPQVVIDVKLDRGGEFPNIAHIDPVPNNLDGHTFTQTFNSNPLVVPTPPGIDQPHEHSLSSGGGFDFTFDNRPPSIGVLYFLKVW